MDRAGAGRCRRRYELTGLLAAYVVCESGCVRTAGGWRGLAGRVSLLAEAAGGVGGSSAFTGDLAFNVFGVS